MRLVSISDTHCNLSEVKLPEGDILIHSGDLTFSGSVKETEKELFELGKYRAKFKAIILVEGNHDFLGERNEKIMGQLCEDNGITLLRDSSAVVEGIKVYGSPYQPEFGRWAWNLPRGKALKDKWDLIPEDVQLLITHSPPKSILDGVARFNRRIGEYELEHVGCVDLYNRVKELKSLRGHFFGHIHSGRGMVKIGKINFVNSSICTERYKPTNEPIVIDIDF
jgi:Icc-related predicted phosphoesterase